MNTIIKTGFGFTLCVALLLSLHSCQKNEIEIQTDNAVPFTGIRVTADGETAVGKLVSDRDHINTVALSYESASNFDVVQIEIDLNQGFECVFPSNLSEAPLADSSVVAFKTPDGRIVKYFFDVSYKNFMIADPTKVGVKNSTAQIRVSDLSKRITIPYDPETMKKSEITLDFKTGSLPEGARVSRTVFDFSKSLEQTFRISRTIDGKTIAKEFKAILAVSHLLTDYSKFGFTNVTESYLGKEYVQDAEGNEIAAIWRADKLSGIPIRNANDAGEYYAETPFTWDFDPGISDDDPSVYAMPGNWKSTRDTEDFPDKNDSAKDILVTVVLLDESAYGAKLYIDDKNHSIAFNEPSLITVSGLSKYDRQVVWNEGNILCEEMYDVSQTTRSNFFRPCVGIGEDGSFTVTTGVWDSKKKEWHNWTGGYREPADLKAAQKFVATKYLNESGVWTGLRSLVTSVPFGCVGGHLLTNLQILAGDFTHYYAAYGSAWNGPRRRCFVGKTFDNRIAIATFSSTKPQSCIGTFQAVWLLSKLGWSDVIQIGTEFYMDDNYDPCIKVGGQAITGSETLETFYSFGFDLK